MASMVKEKRPKKQKNKEKPSARSIVPVNDPSCIRVVQDENTKTEIVSPEVPEQDLSGTTSDVQSEPDKTNPCVEQCTSSKDHVIGHQTDTEAPTEPTHSKELETNLSKHELIETDSYKNLNLQLQRMAIPEQSVEIDQARLLEIEDIDAYLQANIKKLLEASRNAEMLEASRSAESALEIFEPSAPMLEDSVQPEIQEPVYSALPKVECMPLDEAIRLYGGTEMAAVRHMSEREEAEVEAGPNCGPEHPLVDLLSTFRSSLRALERERSKLANNFKDEEKYRNTLWKIEKRKIHLVEDCNCGLKVDMKATYEHAHLLKEKLPVAKLKLEGLLRDVQESYCHHQHAALLAHYLIEDLISETIKSNKAEIRTALSLILQALRVCDGAPEMLPASLQRWAETLAAALVDERDLRQLLFIMHHLFRQTRSVRWAARVLNTRVTDSITAARTLAVLDTLLSKLHLEAAVECIEETEEAWEEVDVKGGGGAVSSGTLRERDLIALLQALPLQQLIARLVLFSQADFRQATDEDWGDASGGNGLLKSCCGVRTLLSILQRAVTTHPLYERLHGMLRGVASSALTALACLYHTPRAPYLRELEGKIIAELEAAFAAGFALFGTHELHKLPTTLLTEDSVKDYCLTFIVGLHDKSPKSIESLSIEAPVLPCDVRIRIATYAAIHREQDHELARIVLDFLLQTGLKRKSSGCKAGCEPASRECVSLLLATHPYLRGLALHTVADLSQVETLDASAVNVLQVDKWRPDEEEMQAVLDDWSKRCPTLLQQLLLQLNYTPYIGLSLDMQMRIGSWLCVWQAATPSATECAWRVLRRLRTHRVCWPDAKEAPPPHPHPADTFSMAYAVLACDWGDSIPKICSEGIKAICKICATRPREAVHCLAPVMLTLTLSPESVSSTPAFAELFTQLINCGPNLVQRAFGRGGVSGSELLLRLVLKQVDVKTRIGGIIHVFPAWMHALWKVPSALSTLDVASIAAKDWYALDVFATDITRNEHMNREYILNAVNYAATSPLLSETILKKLHLNHVKKYILPALYLALHDQRVNSQRIHVDNALVISHAGMPSDELVIYKCANAALVAPLNHPSHVTLWRLFFHIYMERPPEMSNRAPPCGPLFFSGIIKSRLLAQIKRRLQETATYHLNEAQKYDTETRETKTEANKPLRRSQSITKDDSFLPNLTEKDLPGHESDSESDSHAESSSVRDDTDEAIEAEKRRVSNMAAFHRGANRLMREYLRFLEEGDNLREGSMQADHARFIPAEGFAEAWEDTLSRLRPPPSPELDDFIRPYPPPPKHEEPPKTPRTVAVASIQSVKCRPYNRSRRTNRARVDNMNDADYGNIRLILSKVEQLLKEIEKYAQEWRTEVCRIESLDSRLWELVTALRVPRPLPPVKKQCTNKCKSITFHLNTHEWCISEGAERGIKESRSASLAGIRRLSRARPQVAVSAAALQTIARRIRSAEHAVQVLELAWASAGVCLPCETAHATIIALFQQLAERWITRDGELCRQLVQKGCASNCSTLQRTLCGALVAPRTTPPHAWADIYNIVLHSQLPSHTIFSYLSRFEMNRFRDIADENQRTVVLLSLHLSTQLYTKPEDSILLELVGVHTTSMMRAQDLGSLLLHYTSISRSGVLPPAFWTHLNKAAGALAGELLFDDLGNILRSLGSAWFKVEHGNSERTEMYSTYIADLLCILVRAFVAAAVKLTYEPARVGWYAWSAVAESWGPWVLPAGALPPPPGRAYVPMLERLTACVTDLMQQCPGSEPRMLTDIYSWVISTYRSVMRMETNAPRLQMSVLLEEMRALPWTEHQWFTAPSVAPTLDVIQHDDEELILWCCDQFRATKAATFLYDVDKTNTDLPGYLIRLLKLFTGNLYVSNPGLLKEACSLPWWHLSEDCLIEGLNEFFRAHYDVSQPYHDKPQAIVVLAASELCRQPQYSAMRVRKRQHALSHWTSASAGPALQAHRAPYTRYMLEHLTRIEPYLEKPEEARDLLYRLAHLMLWEQTESPNSVPMVWQQWVSAAPASLLSPCVCVASQMTVLRHGAPIADAAVAMHLHKCEGGWSELCQLFSGCVFSARLYAESGCMLAAYARALTASVEEVRPVLAALQAITEGNYDFVKNEAIIAVWICFATRVALECDNTTTVATEATTMKSSTAQSAMKSSTAQSAMKSSTAQSAMKSSTAHVQFTADTKGGDISEECKHTAISLLTAWGQQQRRSLIKVVTLQADTERPTARHRLLVRLAECILSPSPSSAQAYESACASVAGCSGDVTAWGRCPSLRKLLRLAIRLFSTHERYFQWEMDQAQRE